jgi:hypothetical protein
MLQDAAHANRLLWCSCTHCGRAALTHPFTLAELAGVTSVWARI